MKGLPIITFVLLFALSCSDIREIGVETGTGGSGDYTEGVVLLDSIAVDAK